MVRHRGMKPPINSIKHMVQKANSGIASGAILSVVIVDAVPIGAARAATFNVEEGASIKAIFVEVWLKSNADAGLSNQFSLFLERLPSNLATMNFTESQNVQAYENKKNILYSTQGVLGDLTTQSVPVLRQWIAIPKGKQRFGDGDRIVLEIAAIGNVLQMCGIFIYKEYY